MVGVGVERVGGGLGWVSGDQVCCTLLGPDLPRPAQCSSGYAAPLSVYGGGGSPASAAAEPQQSRPLSSVVSSDPSTQVPRPGLQSGGGAPAHRHHVLLRRR